MTIATYLWLRANFGRIAVREPTPERRLRGDVGAVSTELVIIIAGLAALALVVVAIIVAKVTDKANSIPTS